MFATSATWFTLSVRGKWKCWKNWVHFFGVLNDTFVELWELSVKFFSPSKNHLQFTCRDMTIFPRSTILLLHFLKFFENKFCNLRRYIFLKKKFFLTIGSCITLEHNNNWILLKILTDNILWHKNTIYQVLFSIFKNFNYWIYYWFWVEFQSHPILIFFCCFKPK
jgi:hypothetical protein